RSLFIMASSAVSRLSRGSATALPRPALRDPAWLRWTLLGVTFAFVGLFLLLPLTVVFAEGLRNGVAAYFASFKDPDAIAAIKLTLIAAGISVPLNLVFGVSAAWAITKFEFRGKSLFITLIDLPFA